MIYWYSGLEQIEALAAEKGISPEEGVPVISVKRLELLGSSAVKKSLNVVSKGMHCAPLGEIWNYQYDEIVAFLGKRHIEMTEERLDRFAPELSQIVYDDQERVRAVLLCTSDADGIFVHLLLGSSNAAEFIMTVLQGFIKAAMEKKANENDRIYMVAAQDMVAKLLRRMLDKKYQIEVLGRVHCLKTEEDAELAAACREEENKSLVQKNIGWKMAWVDNLETMK